MVNFSDFYSSSITQTHLLYIVQVPDSALVALVPKQVTAYNSVNNSTVSRTSASKYGRYHAVHLICLRVSMFEDPILQIGNNRLS